MKLTKFCFKKFEISKYRWSRLFGSRQPLCFDTPAGSSIVHAGVSQQYSLFKMVKIHQLSAEFILALDIDLVTFKKTCKLPGKFVAGSQLPRTRWGWLMAHYQDCTNKRNDAIKKASQQFNRTRGVPIDTVVFKSPTQYARCLSAIAVNADGEVVYRGANDRIWKTKLRKKSPEEILFGIQTTRAGTSTSARARVRVLFQYGTGKGTYPELRRCDCCY